MKTLLEMLGFFPRRERQGQGQVIPGEIQETRPPGDRGFFVGRSRRDRPSR
jgi:hypothetical protein